MSHLPHLHSYYLRSLTTWDATVMPQLEYAGGIRFYYCWYINGAGSKNMNSAFPQLLRLGTSGFYVYYCYYLQQMNNVMPLITRVDGLFYLYRNYYSLSSIANSFPRLTYIGSYL